MLEDYSSAIYINLKKIYLFMKILPTIGPATRNKDAINYIIKICSMEIKYES